VEGLNHYYRYLNIVSAISEQSLNYQNIVNRKGTNTEAIKIESGFLLKEVEISK